MSLSDACSDLWERQQEPQKNSVNLFTITLLQIIPLPTEPKLMLSGVHVSCEAVAAI
jgi:hypothetical protein